MIDTSVKFRKEQEFIHELIHVQSGTVIAQIVNYDNDIIPDEINEIENALIGDGITFINKMYVKRIHTTIEEIA